MTAEHIDHLIEQALTWGRTGEPIAWSERFPTATGREHEDLVRLIGFYWSDVRVTRVDLTPVDDTYDVHQTLHDGRWHTTVPYRNDWVASRLLAVAVLGPPSAPDAVLGHVSEHVEGDPMAYDIAQLAVVLPNERTGVTEPTVVWLPAPPGRDPETSDEAALRLPVTEVVIARAFRAVQSAQNISLTVDYAHSHAVCDQCWRNAKTGAINVQLFSSHRQAHHERLGICVDAGLTGLIDAVLDRGWSSYAGCEGIAGRERSAYLALREKLDDADLTALEAAGCETLTHNHDGTAFYWDPVALSQVVAAIQPGS